MSERGFTVNYIVFDLEWNQPIDGKAFSERKLPFEIIEIGAVKLDENRNKIAEFSEIIRPQVYKELNVHIKKILNTSMAELMRGGTFYKIMERFRRWYGEDMIFCTWGIQDLTELQRNMTYYNMEPLSRSPLLFLNVQKMFAVHQGNPDKAYSLETAVDEAGLEKDIPFHRAFSDAYYTAKILKLMTDDEMKAGITYDLYHIPFSEAGEISIYDNGLGYFVSRGYKEREKITGNRDIMALKCEKCGGAVIRKSVNWFSSNSKNYYCAGVCHKHGPIKGRLRVRHHDSGLYFAEKYTEYTTKEEVSELREKKRLLKEKQESEPVPVKESPAEDA